MLGTRSTLSSKDLKDKQSYFLLYFTDSNKVKTKKSECLVKEQCGGHSELLNLLTLLEDLQVFVKKLCTAIH